MIFKKQPWKHQLEALERAKNRDTFGLFFEQGTGKSGCSINIVRYRFNEAKRHLRTLIFCPPIVIENWKREFEIHSDIIPSQIILLQGPGSKRLRVFNKEAYPDCSAPGKIFVTNYEALLMKPLFNAMCEWQPEFLICDESHKLKDPSAKRSKAMAILADPIKYKLILTGTPVLNSPIDLFGQFRVLDGGETFGKNFFIFRQRFFYDASAAFKNTGHYFPDWRIKPKSLEEINEIISTKSMTVKKATCLDLPPLVKQRIYTDMTDEQAKAYLDMKTDLVAYMDDKACVATLAITKALRLLQIASGYVKFEDGSGLSLKDTPKMNALSELLETLTPDHKVIVWACFKDNYAQIRKVCQDLKIEYVEVHGEIKDKQESVDRFNTVSSVRVLISNPSSGGIGINLCQSDYSIFYSRNFSLENDLQAEARNHRGGSEIHEKITRIDLVARGTIDELVLESLANKTAIGEALLKEWKGNL